MRAPAYDSIFSIARYGTGQKKQKKRETVVENRKRKSLRYDVGGGPEPNCVRMTRCFLIFSLNNYGNVSSLFKFRLSRLKD